MNKRGFTLIELMVVIVVIGILASISYPTYASKINRVKIEQSVGLADVAKEEIQAFYKRYGRMPKNNAEASLPDSKMFISNFTTDIEVKDGAIHITMGNKVSDQIVGKRVSIRPAVVKGAPKVPISWIAGYASVPKGMTALGENLTDVDSSFLSYEYRW